MEYDPNVSQPTDFPQYLVTKVPEIPTLRDFFAGCALIGMMRGNDPWHIPTDAVTAFECADAMLKAREVE